jgi:hypothetical protein
MTTGIAALLWNFDVSKRPGYLALCLDGFHEHALIELVMKTQGGPMTGNLNADI